MVDGDQFRELLGALLEIYYVRKVFLLNLQYANGKCEMSGQATIAALQEEIKQNKTKIKLVLGASIIAAFSLGLSLVNWFFIGLYGELGTIISLLGVPSCALVILCFAVLVYYSNKGKGLANQLRNIKLAHR